MQTVIDQVAEMSDEGTDDEEFFDAVDAGEVEVEPMLPPSDVKPTDDTKQIVVSGVDISSSFKGYENGIRHKLNIDADNRPKISLWVGTLLQSFLGILLTVSITGYLEVNDWQRHD